MLAPKACLCVWFAGIIVQADFVSATIHTLAAEECLLNHNRNPSLSREQIEDWLRCMLGVQVRRAQEAVAGALHLWLWSELGRWSCGWSELGLRLAAARGFEAEAGHSWELRLVKRWDRLGTCKCIWPPSNPSCLLLHSPMCRRRSSGCPRALSGMTTPTVRPAAQPSFAAAAGGVL